MKNTFNFEKGLQEAKDRLEKITERPRFVAVFGYPDSGKSFLISQLTKYLRERGLTVFDHSDSCFSSYFEGMRTTPSEIEVELFHCAFQREDHFDFEDPNNLAMKYLKRGVNLNIGIYNPILSPHKPTQKYYDLIIINRDSFRKYS